VQKPTDDFPVLWESLSETQRKFLLAAYDIDDRLPHSEGLDKVIPLISWRTVGLMCGVNLQDVDALVRTLADLRLVYILDLQRCEMALISRTSLMLLAHAQRKKRWDRATLAAVIATIIAMLWWHAR
jgi:hypothetical protein